MKYNVYQLNSDGIIFFFGCQSLKATSNKKKDISYKNS